MLKNLHKLVIKSYLGPLVLTFFIAEFVLIMQFLFLYIGDLVGKGLEWYIIAELLTYASARLAQMALPLAILLASIMTFGNMGEHFELSAMKSAGISLQRIMKPLIIFSVVLSIGSFFFANYVIPYTNLKMGSLLYDISNKRPEMNIKQGVFSNDIPNFSIKIRDKSKTSNMMYGFMIYDHRSHRGNVKVTLADSGFMEITGDQKYMIITLFGGKSYEEMKDEKPVLKNRPENHSYFDKQVSVFKLEDMDMKRTNENLFRHSHHMQRLGQLERSSDSLTKVLKRKNNQYVKHLQTSNYFKYEVKYTHKRDSLKYIADSIRRLQQPDSLEVIANLDSIYKTLSVSHKEHVASLALDNAKATRKYISVSQEDFYSRQKRINKHGIAWHNKFTLAFACLIFFFIGAPLGAIIRKGGFGLPFLVSITFFILYYVVSLMGKKFVEESVLLPWQGMWMSSLITMPLGVLFTYKATTDSVLFDIGAYTDFIKRLFNVNKIEYRDPDSVFHKDVENLSGNEFLQNVTNLKLEVNKLALEVENSRKPINLYSMQFKYDTSSLENFVKNYNVLYPVLAIRTRHHSVFYKSLQQFPKVNIEDYELSKAERIANYFLMTIGIIPVGILLLIRASFKQKVLVKKLRMIENLLAMFEENIDPNEEIYEEETISKQEYSTLSTKIAEVADARTAEKAIKITDEEILTAIEANQKSVDDALNYLNAKTDNVFEFLTLVFSDDILEIEQLPNQLRLLKNLLHKKDNNNKLINDILDQFVWIDFDKYRIGSKRIFFHYVVFGFALPLSAPIFYAYYKKIKELILELQDMQTTLASLHDLISSKKYEENILSIDDECELVFNGKSELSDNEQINILVSKFKTDLSHQIDFLKECDNSFFKYLDFAFTRDFSEDMKDLHDYHRQAKNFINDKYEENEHILNRYKYFLEIDNLEYKKSKLAISVNYFFLTIYPIGFIYFVINEKKLKNIIENLENIYSKLLV